MANAGGAWDNAKKIVEVDMNEKGTELHAATVVGDTVGDPFKDTSSVALNPVIKFTTLFGLLAVELAVSISKEQTSIDFYASTGVVAEPCDCGRAVRDCFVVCPSLLLRNANWQSGVIVTTLAKC